MKILSPQQIKALDAFTIKKEPISSWDLMERAASSITDYLIQQYPNISFYIFCGSGNNAGDGLAVTRLLQQAHHKAHAFVIELGAQFTTDAQKNMDHLKHIKDKHYTIVTKLDELNSISTDAIVIDALFGTGLNRPLAGLAAEVSNYINKLPNKVIAIDIPSGLMADISPNKTQALVKAEETLSFQMPKLSFLFPDCQQYVGKWTILDIGLSEKGMAEADTHNYFIEQNDVKKILKTRGTFDHKGTFGHALLIAGSYGKMGAAVLASKACLKSGVGLLTCHIPHWGYQIIQTAVPEAMVNIDRSEMYFTEFPKLDAFAAIGVGPGLNKKANSVKALSELLESNTLPIVLDADALNILAENKALFKHLGPNTILTPHPGEFKRLVGDWKCDSEKIEKLKAFCKQNKLTTVLKGAYTITCLPDTNCYFNSTGNPGMASAGSGDVLTGIILSLLSQGYSCKDASILGVYLHGLAADLALSTESQESLIASDIINSLANAFKHTKQ